MVAELGNFALIVALMAAVWQSVFPLVGALRQDGALAAGGGNAALAQVGLIAFFLCLSDCGSCAVGFLRSQRRARTPIQQNRSSTN